MRGAERERDGERGRERKKERKRERVRERENKKRRDNDSLQTERTWEHKALTGTDSSLLARCNVYPMGRPPKGNVAYHKRRDQQTANDRRLGGWSRYLTCTMYAR